MFTWIPILLGLMKTLFEPLLADLLDRVLFTPIKETVIDPTPPSTPSFDIYLH